jgi:RNA polymerase sigma-70 factor (ECF subfamily)
MSENRDNPFNEDYIRRLAEGDPEVQRHFVNHFSTLLRIKLRTKLRSSQVIEDIRQETFLRVLQSLKKEKGLHSPERLGGFVNSVCNNVILESFRSSIRHRQMPDDVPELIDDSADPTLGALQEERATIVRRILSELPEKDREILRLVFLEEHPKDGICKDMNVNPEYLRVLVHRAKARFRQALTQLSPENRTGTFL